ncbi:MULTISPECIES: Stk1 family PASTA domain-containing Ser/Thr kinase [unclassified Corynebacterium]|uniref:Stk1 family PASTA domain-containing Ser/Thr kinase n=1 Tax=unclassified Corynebacterium TaxID=2624378 RepID=UPI001EF6EEC2|nr:Stk1 family PASTA domain-containing Ser/Thr kinase [Corynebacterium sp. ACRQK]MCG7263153.1 Stk1 family PASTA domain-containing Ser/Thr kinase [Corynebacterium sp. ACRQL]
MSELHPGDLLEWRYRIGAQIARGGMSTVYAAIDTRLDREVAVKVMDPTLAREPAFRTRFEREARAVAKLSDPSLVNVFDQGVDDEYVFLVMELVEGGSLRELLKERGPMPPHAAIAVMRPVLTALSIAHAKGMIHRDIKPDNVLISDRNQVKLADFGLVRAINKAMGDPTNATTSVNGQVIGTVGYLSPEQVRGENLTQASDVYSAGILLFELLTGRTPFKGGAPIETAMARINRPVPAPSTLMPDIPPKIDELVLRACHRDPTQRFVDGAEFLEAVEQAAEDLDVPDFQVPAPTESAVRSALAGTDFGERTPWDDESMSTRAVVLPKDDRTRPETHHTAVTQHQPPYAPHSPSPHSPAPHSPSPQGPAHPGPHHPAPHRSAPHQPTPARQAPKLSNKSPVATVFWIVLLIALVIGMALGGWWFTTGRYGEIPTVIGMDKATAQATVEEAGFSSTLDERYDNQAEKNTVMGTDPVKGQKAVRGSEVAVLLSLGKPTVPDPGTNSSLQYYTSKLTDRTLKVKKGDDVYSDEIAKGHVAEVQPAAGTEVNTGSTVEVRMSKGKRPVTVPGVKGQDRERAKKTLEKAGLQVAEETEEFNKDIPAGQAIRTDPKEGVEVESGTEVTLVLSNAIEVPDVQGLSVDDARKALRKAGLNPVDGAPVEDSSEDAGDVAEQSPGAGELVDPSRNTDVEIRESTSQRVPWVLGLTAEKARKKLEGAGFEVEIKGDPNGLVLGQSPGPSSRSHRGAVVTLTTV